MRASKLIRPSFVFPFFAVCALLVIYLIFFLELHLKYIIERSAFESLGTEVNIGKLNIQPLKSKLSLLRIQFTDPDKPTQNIFELEKVELRYKTRALLDLSFQSDLVEIKNIRFHTPRKYPGRVLSADKRVLVLKDPSTHKITDEIKKKYDENSAFNLAKLVKGDLSDSELKELKSKFSSTKLYDKLEEDKNKIVKDLSEFKKELESKKIKDLSQKLKDFKFDSSSTEKSLTSSKKALDLIDEVKSTKKNLKGQLNSIKAQIKDFKKRAKSAPDQLISDLDIVKNDYKRLDPSVLSAELFGEYFALQLSKISRVKSSITQSALDKVQDTTSIDLKDQINQSQNSEPQKEKAVDTLSRSELEKQRQALIRKKGRVFFKKDSQPEYWLKEILISSKASEGQDLGDCDGFIKNLSSHPEYIKKPLSFKIKGSAPKQDIGFFDINGIIDRINKAKPSEIFKVEVSKYQIKDFEILKDSDAFLNYKESEAKSLISFKQENDQIQVNLDQILIPRIADYKAEDKNLNTILKEVSKLSPVEISLQAKGSLADPKIKITSNLAKSFINSIKNTGKSLATEKINKEVSKWKNKISADYFAKANQEHSELDLSSRGIENSVNSLMETEVNRLKEKANAKKKEKIDELKDKLFKKIKL